jgi:para-nitrobenzyl esterase
MKHFRPLWWLLFLICPVSRAEAPPRVALPAGVLEGAREGGLFTFKGVPFAAPPVGQLRWREPQPVRPWKSPRKAGNFAARCMQRPVFSDMNFRSNGMSEDCLYLNVWTATIDAAARQPVLVYFYGGGFVAGDGSEYRYDGASMARRGITTVTVNYRLDVFGTLAHPELTRESPHAASGNYALLDQVAALRWVHDNIAAFGGDPSRVTIAGESAGSMAVSGLMASPLSKNLVAGAIGESGSALAMFRPLADAEKTGVDFAKAAGANSIADLRAIPADKLLELAGKPGTPRNGIIRDGYFFPKDVTRVYEEGEQAHVPLLAGTNSQESWWGVILRDKPPTRENFTKGVQERFPEPMASRLLALYPAATDADVEYAAGEFANDLFLSYGTWRWIDAHGATSGQPTFYYLYARPRPATVANPSAPPDKVASHSAEIEYALGNLATNKVYAWTADDHHVSEVMQGFFANFIKTGNPNGKGLPQWEAYNRGDAHARMTIDVATRPEPDARRARYIQLREILEGKSAPAK